MPAPAAALRDQTFAANRATGHIALSVIAAHGSSRRARVHEAGSLRVRFPNSQSDSGLDAVIVNSAGGMTGGDRFDLGIDVGAGAALVWLPQETILFNQVRLRRTIDIELSGSAHLLLAEAIVFGRAAMGEIVSVGHLFDRWRVRRDGALILAETMRIDGAIAKQLADRP